MPIINFLHNIREIELKKAISEMPSPQNSVRKISLLEIGSGTGRQAKILKKMGFDVKAIDIPSSSYRNQREFDIIEYNGTNLPCETQSIQIAFSSNVLEHVPHIEEFLTEIYRVLDDHGQAIHILPTSYWRFWSIITHYGWVIKKTGLYFNNLLKSSKINSISPISLPETNRDFFRILFPTRHGERGNTLTEIYYFSEWWWKKKFTTHGFLIKKITPNGLFYTDSSLLNEALSFAHREMLAKILGSSCKIYVLEKAKTITSSVQ